MSETGWLLCRYADWTAYEKAQESFAQDPEYQRTVTEIAKIAKRITRELVIDIAL